MTRFSIVCNSDTIIDGHSFKSGTAIGTLETNLPWDNVVSGLRNMMLSVVREAPPAPTPTTQSPPLSTTTEPQVAKPEILPPSNQGAAVDASETSEAPSEEIDPLAGLSPKLAESLREALEDGRISKIGSLDTPEKVQAAIDSGFDLTKLDGIGIKGVQKIKDWLSALKGE